MLDFPGSPATGATYTGPNGVIWQFDGAKWLAGTSASVYAGINSPVFTGDPQAPQPAAGDADASIATTKFVTDAVATSLHDVGRNYIHNSMFNIAQRGAGPWTTSVYTADRWFLGVSLDTTSVSLISLNDASRAQIGDEAATRCLQNTFTGNAGAAAVSYIHQPMEGVLRFSGKTVTISFWAAASAALKIGVNIYQNFGTGGSPSTAGWVLATGNAITLSTSWTRYTTTIVIPSAAGKTLGTNGDDGTWLRFFYSAGSSSAAIAGNIGVQGPNATIQLWGVQLELGPGPATPLEKLDPVTQLQQAQRFFQLVSINTYVNNQLATGENLASTAFAVTMRGTPIMGIQSNTSQNLSSAAAGGDTRIAFLSGTTTANGTTKLIATLTASADL